MKYQREILIQLAITLVIGIAVTFMSAKYNTDVNTIKLENINMEVSNMRERIALVETFIFESKDK